MRRLLVLLVACCMQLLTADGIPDEAVPPVRLRHEHHGNHHHHHHHHEHHWGPFFEGRGDATTHALAVPLGASVTLDCRVGMLHDKTVLWVRRRDDGVRLLTVGQAAYTRDPRLTVHFQYPNNWRLAISGVTREDEGVYLCQVSTHPPRVLATNLTVLAPELRVVDEHGHSVHDRYYKTGSTIELTCQVATPAGTPATRVTWKKDDAALPGKVAPPVFSESQQGIATSRLVVPTADATDSGVYSCESPLSSALVTVHVLHGEKQAAVQHDSWGTGTRTPLSVITQLLIVCLMLVHLAH